MSRETYETSQPWVIYTYLTPDPEHDGAFVSEIRMECAVCGASAIARVEVEAVGEKVDLPPGYQHPERAAFRAAHVHRPLPHALTWAMPLRNPAAHRETLDVLQTVANQTGATIIITPTGAHDDHA